MTDIVGKRVYPRDDGFLEPRDIDAPASYGRATSPLAKGAVGWWQVTAPDGRGGILNPNVHNVAEHDDGTITVIPSIDFSKTKRGGWHGWLIRGVFKSC